MKIRSTTRFQYVVLHVEAFVVSLCSFAYELVYSELLTVMYGGAVVQYGLTIGLFFSSLGAGAFLCRAFDDDRPTNFVRTEVYLAIVAPAGVAFILVLNAYSLPPAVPADLEGILARVPVVLVGVLSGFELPLLLGLADGEASGREFGGRFVTLVNAVRAGVLRVLGVFFHVSPGESEYDRYSTVLGMDYLGGLAGALIHVFVLYPRFGLFPTVLWLALLNAVAALVFVLTYGDRRWDRESTIPGDTDAKDANITPRRIASPTTRETRALLVVCVLLAATYGGLVVNHESVNDRASAFYLENSIEREHPRGTVDVDVTDQVTTRYQHVATYERTWTGAGPNPWHTADTERCLRMDAAIQLCDSWAESYHAGLVDVPMALFPHDDSTRVLVVGGGDWIAIDHLRRYGVTIDHVDVDSEFMDHARTDPFLAEYHDDAYEYDRLETTVGDAYAYLERTDRSYDLILLDLPGAEDDDVMHLYSTEFFHLVRDRLADDGVVATWVYSEYEFPTHNKVYVNTLEEAGFERYAPYWAYDDVNGDGTVENIERFYLLAPEDEDDRPALPPPTRTSYVTRHIDRYDDLEWRRLVSYRGVDTHSVFHPNYDVLITEGP